MKNKTFKTSYCGIIAALSAVLTFCSAFQGFVYLAPAAAGVFIWTVKRLSGIKWALLCFAVSSMIVFMTAAEPEAALFFAGILGWWPLLSENVNEIKPSFIGYVIRLGVFNTAAILIYKATVFVIGIDFIKEELFLGDYTAAAVLILGNITFIVYDKALETVFLFFEKMIFPKILKI